MHILLLALIANNCFVMYEAFAIQFLSWFSTDERLSTSLNCEGIISIPNPWRRKN